MACGGGADTPPGQVPTGPGSPTPAQVTRVLAYLRTDTSAYAPAVAGVTNVTGAQVSLGTVTGTMPATGTLSLSTTVAPTVNLQPLDVTAPGYQATTYPWFAADTAQAVAMGMYPSVTVLPRPGFVKGIDFMDSGGGLATIYQNGRHAMVMDRVKALLGANLVRTNEAFDVTKFNTATNTVEMTVDPFNVYDRAVYANLVSQARARGLQFEMGLEIGTFGRKLSAEDAANFAGRFTIPVTNTAFWDAYFAAFRPLVLDRAAIARDLGIEYLDLWNLQGLIRPESSRFQKLVADIRALGYTGKLIYFYNAGVETGFPEWNSVDAGFRALWDINGVSIRTVVAKADASEVLADAQPRSRMRTSVSNALNTLASRPQPIIIMMRVPSVFGGIVHPEFIEPCIVPACNSLAPLRTRDYQQQADAYQAVAEVVNATPIGNGRVMGMISAQYWYYDDFFSGGINDYSKINSVRAKPAEAVLSWWWKRW
ncbi:MAG TPA: hypothetical protein VM053_06515 [Gemmatimonadaceae bacterium]|nr:hypothetical protein [Gemmatimonadaceae bacterium]